MSWGRGDAVLKSALLGLPGVSTVGKLPCLTACSSPTLEPGPGGDTLEAGDCTAGIVTCSGFDGVPGSRGVLRACWIAGRDQL